MDIDKLFREALDIIGSASPYFWVEERDHAKAGVWAKRALTFFKAHRDFKPDNISIWTTERPAPGKWRVSIRPEIRRGFSAVVECEVWKARPDVGMVVQYRPGGDLLPLDQDWFSGAQWQRIDEIADPFARGGGE